MKPCCRSHAFRPSRARRPVHRRLQERACAVRGRATAGRSLQGKGGEARRVSFIAVRSCVSVGSAHGCRRFAPAPAQARIGCGDAEQLVRLPGQGERQPAAVILRASQGHADDRRGQACRRLASSAPADPGRRCRLPRPSARQSGSIRRLTSGRQAGTVDCRSQAGEKLSLLSDCSQERADPRHWRALPTVTRLRSQFVILPHHQRQGFAFRQGGRKAGLDALRSCQRSGSTRPSPARRATPPPRRASVDAPRVPSIGLTSPPW